MTQVQILTNSLLYLAIIITAFLFMRRQLYKGTSLFRIILAFTILVSVALLAETMNRLDYFGHISLPFPIYALTVVFNYLILPAASGLWLLYIYTSVNPESISKRFVYGVSIVVVINAIFTLVSLIPQANFYFVLSGNSYARGNFYWFYGATFILFYFATLYVYLRSVKIIRYSQRYIFFILFTAPLVGFFGQYFLPQTPFVIISYVFSYMILAMSVQYIHATTDFLTGLANRQNLSMYLQRKMKTVSADGVFAVIMLDLDNFKQINDTLGHTFGDDVLRLLARFLKTYLQENDFIARYGGDEFIIITDKVDSAELEDYINTMRTELETFAADSFGPYKLSFSSGYFFYDRNAAVSLVELFETIDKRMFKDKRDRAHQRI